MSVRILSTLCLLGLGCGGAQRAADTPVASNATASSDTPDRGRTDPAQTEGVRADTEALHKLAQEQAEMMQLFQLLATQVATLQEEVEKLRDEEKHAAPVRPSRPRPDPASVYSIPISESPAVGSRKPLVTIVKAFEFACPYCNKSRTTIDQLLKDYKGDLRVVYKHFIVHPQSATDAARAACAADQQGKWQPMYELIWDQAFTTRDFSVVHLEKLARQAKLRMKRFRADRDGACAERVRQDQADLGAVGTTGTPAFFINGRFLSGARPIDQFKTLIDEELAKAQQRIGENASLSRANYYDQEVLFKGERKLEAAP